MLGMRMAASSAKRTEETCKMFLAFALLLLASLLNVGVTAQDVVTGPPGTVEAEEQARGDNVVKTTAIPEPAHPEIPQIWVFPTLEKVTMPEQVTTAAVIKDAADTGDVGDAVDTGDNVDNGPAAPEEAADEGNQSTAQEHADVSKDEEPQTQAPMPSRGDGPINKPQPVPQDDVVCVSKDAVQHKNAVNLKLKASSNCEETKVKIGSVLQELCGEDCKLEIYQQDNSDEIIVSGKYVEDDVQGMANKFNNDNIKDKTDVMEAVPRWGKKSKLVLVTLLLAGLLLAALLIAGYYLMTHRKNSKGVRLAESFQVDEENQANTLVSVAPLPQEPVDKPIANGESPPENGTSSAPQTNGHSQTPVADTEM